MTAQTASCRDCGGWLDTILNLGNLHPSAFPLPGEPLPAPVPLDLCACHRCRLVQLRHTVPAAQLFTEQYWYRSGVNEVMRAELQSVVADAIARVEIGKFDYVVDVGANDGTLLAAYRDHYQTMETQRLAFEPARNLHQELFSHAEAVHGDFFPHEPATQAIAGKVKILTTIACFYATDDPHTFVDAVRRMLHPQGVWVVQFQDLHQMVQATAFDNICHEHLIYYSLASFERLIAPHGLVVCDAEIRAINGGSYRLYVKHAEAPIPGGRAGTAVEGYQRVSVIRQAEQWAQDWDTLERFAWRVGQARTQIQAAVAAAIQAGGTVDLYGASTKANTLLQYCGLDGDVIRYAIERSPEKWRRETGTGIPIISEAAARHSPADAWLLGIWQFRDAVLKREADYLTAGGRVIVPLPRVEIVQQAGAWVRP